MASWQITLTTVYCEKKGGEVTIVVNNDFSARCTGQTDAPGDGRSNTGRGNGSKNSGCDGEQCRLVAQYKEKLAAEERLISPEPD